MRLSQNCFCKKFLGILFFGERVYMDIHDEPKNKITTKFTAKGRFCDSLKIGFGIRNCINIHYKTNAKASRIKKHDY